MRLTITLKPLNNEVALPIHYNYIVQAALYKSIDTKLAEFLHKQGYLDIKRVFRMFSFSLLQGPFTMDRDHNLIIFRDEIKVTICSPINTFCHSMANTLLSRGHMYLGQHEVSIEKISVEKDEVNEEEIYVRTISPVVLYSTFMRPEGRKYTCYFQPNEPDYDRLLTANLQKKYRAFFKKESPVQPVHADALGIQKLSVINYKGTVIKGYSGKLRLSGPIALLQLAVDAGIGGKNAQGFGCLQLLHKTSKGGI